MMMENRYRTENGCLALRFSFHGTPVIDLSRRQMQPGSPLSSPAKNTKKQKVSGTSIVKARNLHLVDGTISCPSFASWNCEKVPSFHYSLLVTPTLDRIAPLPRQGPSLNPRYPRVFASHRPHRFSNPMQQGLLQARALPHQPLWPLQLPVLGMEG
jgi:hypothetical protein